MLTMKTHWMSVPDEYSNEYSRPSTLPHYIGKIAIVVDVQQAFFSDWNGREPLRLFSQFRLMFYQATYHIFYYVLQEMLWI